MKRYKRLLSLACTLVLVLSLMPLQAGAGENYDGVINVVDGTGTGNGWALEGDYIRIKENGAYLISGGGQAASNRICVNSSVTASVTLDNVNININLPFEVGKNSDVTMILKDGSTNILRSSAGHAAIRVFSTAKLTITTAGQSLGNGSLEAYGAGECTSHWASAGIGGSELEASGTIVIDGGNILAVGGSGRGPGTWRGQGGAGIGGAMGRSCGDITINGGNVTAYGGSGDPMGAGIGGGSSDSEKYAGKITINGGTVRAYSGKGKTGDSALGTGIGFCSSVAISDNADVQAYSSGNFPAIYATAVGGGHSAYLLNFMLDARVTSDADMTIKQGDGSVESFNMTLPAIYKNFAATVKSGNDYTAALADGSKKVVSLVGENADFPGILDSLDAIFSSTDVKFVEVDTTPPVLTEGAVYRESAANATVRFFSDEAGTYYYKLMDNETLPDPSNLSDWTSGELTANAINIVTFTGMASGPQYLHILAKDGTGNESDVLTISMPYDLYYSENFETYAEGGYPANFYRKYNGAGDGEQKIIASTQMDGDSGKVFRLKGASSWSSDSRVNLPLGITGTVVYEADIKPVSEVPGSIQMGQGGQWVNCVVRAGLSGGKFYSEKGEYDKPGFLSVKSDAPYSLSNWYSLRLELDYTNKKFDYYVNGVKVNTDTLDAHPDYNLEYFSVSTGNTGGGNEIYFDNIRIYGSPTVAPVLQSATTNGDGTKVILTFDKDMIVPELSGAVFAVIVNDNLNPVTGTALDPSNAKKIVLTLSSPIAEGDAVSVSYPPGAAIKSTDGGVLLGFSDRSVTNVVTSVAPILKAGAVYRTSANAATVRFVSDLNGTYYYKVTDSAAAPDTADLSTWANGGAVTADAITVVTLSDMASGPQHLHILAKSGAGNVSDVLTVSMPYDLYFFEDFEIYDGITNTNPVHHIPTHDGAGTDEQKVISVAQADGTTGKVFRLQGTRNMISERRVDLPSEITAMVVYEADIKPISEEPGGIQLRGSSPGWDDAVIREALRGGKFYSWTGEGGLSGFKYSEVDYSTDTWYKLRVEWDYLKKSFNYYVNNNWVGSDILSANATDILNSFELTSGNSGGGDEVYFDNIKFYAYPAPKLTSVTAPAAMTLANEYASTDAVISGGELPATVAITAEDGTVTLPCVWSFPAGEYDAALGAGNTFRWTVNTFGYDVNNQTVSGSVIITNKAAPPVVDKPVISPDGGAFTGSQAVTLTCGTNGASVYYTTDGSEPSAASTLYAGAFTVFDTTTVKAIATKAGMTDSDVASATFTKNKLLSVTAPAAMTLANEYASADAVISGGELPATVAITAEDGAVTLLCVWSFPAGVYDAAPGAENSFRWTATTAGYDENGQTVSGDVIITNKAAPQPPAPPVRGGSGGSTYVAPVSSGSDRMDAKAKISGNTAAVTMDESKLEQLLGDENAGDTLTLAVTPGRNIHTASVNANELKKIAEAASDPNCPVKNMEIKLDTGTIQLDADALNSISSGDSKEPIEFHVENIPQEDLTAEQRGALPKENEQDIIVRVTVSQGGKKIGTFGGGKVTILIPYVLKEGQNPEGVRVWYVAPDGSLVAVEATYDAGLGVARIVTDHLSEFIVRYDETLVWENLFTDVLSGDWFYGAIKFVSLNKLMYGVGDNLFDPHGSMTRGMIVTILHRLEGTPEAKTANPFDDVAANKYYSKAIIWAAENDIVSGYGNSKFGPDDHITREQIAAIFMNYARYKGYDISARAELGKFADAGKVSGWAIDAMSWANAEALVKGDGVNLNPTANAERCQAAAIFQRFIENIK